MNHRPFRFVAIVLIALSVLFSLACITTTICFWKAGFAESDRLASMLETSNRVDELKSGKWRKEIDRSLAVNDVASVLRGAQKLNDDIRLISRNRSFFNDEELRRLEEWPERLSELQKGTSLQGSMTSLAAKVKNFEAFAIENHWQTLERTASRIWVRVGRLDDFNVSRYQETNRVNRQDINLITTVTEASSIANGLKGLIFTRVKSMEQDLQRTDEYLEQYRSCVDTWKLIIKDIERWNTHGSDQGKMAFIEYDRHGKHFLIVLLLISIVSLALPPLALWAYRRWRERVVLQWGQSVIEAVTATVSSSSPVWPTWSSPEQCEHFSRLHASVQNKLESWDMLQSAIPFPAILVDSHLKVIWANPAFLSDWDVHQDDLNNEMVSWTYLARFADVPTEEMVRQVILGNAQGPIRVRVAPTREATSRHFELRMSMALGHSRTVCMLVFIPVDEHVTAVEAARQSVIRPVVDALTAMQEGHWNSRMEAIEESLSGPEMGSVFSLLRDFHETRLLQIDQLSRELDRVEMLLQSEQQALHRAHDMQNDASRHYAGAMQDLIQLKENWVSLVDVFRRYMSTAQECRGFLDSLVSRLHQVTDDRASMLDIVAKNKSALPDIQHFKDELVQLKTSLGGSRDQLLTDIDELALLARASEASDDRVSDGVGRLKRGIRDLVHSLEHIEKHAMLIDVQLSKTRMVFEASLGRLICRQDGESIEVDVDHDTTEDVMVLVDTYLQSMHDVENEYSALEDSTIARMKEVYLSFRLLGSSTRSATAPGNSEMSV